jgi:hypothetical protein
MTEMILNGLTVTITDHSILILDNLDDVTSQEAMKIVKYLYNEGFIDRSDFPYQIIKDNE